jgi:hypothetical protein
MLVLGLVHGNGWEPPDHGWAPDPPPEEDAPGRRDWNLDWRKLPWRALAWLGVWAFLMAIVPFVSSTFGGLAGFLVLMVAVALAFWRLERFCARQYWDGLRDFKL